MDKGLLRIIFKASKRYIGLNPKWFGLQSETPAAIQFWLP